MLRNTSTARRAPHLTLRVFHAPFSSCLKKRNILSVTLVFSMLYSISSDGPPVPRAAAESDSASMEIDDFTTRKTDDTGNTIWTLKGEQAAVSGEKAALEDILLRLYPAGGPGQKVWLRSPQCNFNRSTRHGSSPAPLFVKTDAFRLSGQGYNMKLKEHKLHIKNNVQMVIKKKELEKSEQKERKPAPTLSE